MKSKRKIIGASAAFLAAAAITASACGSSEILHPNSSENLLLPSHAVGSLSADGKFFTDYETLDEEQLAAKRLSVQIAEEGDVLLKNENGALPLSEMEKRVTLFGIKSVKLVEAGGGSGAGGLDNNGIKHSTVKSSLEDAGFKVNEKTLSLYDKLNSVSGAAYEIPVTHYTSSVVSTYKSYNDAAIITLGRVGAENIDCATNNVPGHSDEDEHYLQLDDNEVDLIKHVKSHFKKVIVLINSANIMQIADLAEPKTEDNLGVDAILWVGTTGNNAIDAVGSILNGTVNPSGHTTDLWSADFTKDPTFANFGYNSQNYDEYEERMDAFYYDENGERTNYTQVEYREDIYIGYRYYETVCAEMNAIGKDGTNWYLENVLYPYGFGLSYTQFEWELVDTETKTLITAANETVTVKVKVTNTGNVAGKDVVQIYYGAPYTKGGIEKSAVNLVTFEKTGMLEPGESEILTLRFVAQDMASYDYDDINDNGFYGWELESGEYTISACRNSHEPVLSVTRVVESGINCETDYATGAEVQNVFVDDDATVNETLLANKISRTDLADALVPEPSSKEDRTITRAEINRLNLQDTYEVWRDSYNDPYYVSEVPEGWTQAEKHESDYSDVVIKLSGMAGISKDRERWVTFMNQLTWKELCDLVTTGTGAVSLPSIDKEYDRALDGPVQIKGGTLFACAGITAATFNRELAYEMGRMVGNECIFKGVTSWLGPGMNIHRSPFSGRNFEYYSEDGVHSGIIAAEVVKGATDKGIITYIKHFFANDQESYRADFGGVCTWATEQALREIYVRPFEYAVKAGSMGIMSSFNRLGYSVTANSYAVLNTLLREQFGFTGAVVTDAWTKDYNPINLMVRAGNDQVLGSGNSYPKNDLTRGEWDARFNCVRVPANEEEKAAGVNSALSPTHYVAVRTCAMNILYTRANSIANKNRMSVADMEVTIIKGVNDSARLEINGSADMDVKLASGQSLPAGLSIKNGTVTGSTNAEEGDYTARVSVTADGWVNTSGTLTVHIVNAFEIGGKTIGKNATENLTAEEYYEALIDSDYYAYGAIHGRQKVMAYYEDPESGLKYNRDEDKSAADIITYPYNPEHIAHEFKMEVNAGSLPEGLELIPVTGIVKGHNGRDTYETTVAYKLCGIPAKEGEYKATIRVTVPYADLSGSLTWIGGRGEKTYFITLNFIVE